MHQYFLKLEMIETHQSKEDDNESVQQQENWIDNMNPMLSKEDQNKYQRSIHRFIEVDEIAIQSSHKSYFIRKNKESIALQHGDILVLPTHQVKVHLINTMSQREPSVMHKTHAMSSVNQIINPKAWHDSMRTKRFIQPEHTNEFMPERVEKKKINNPLHDLVPSKASFSMPVYHNEHEQPQRAMQVSKPGNRSHSSQASEDQIIQIKVENSPLDGIQKLYDFKDSTRSSVDSAVESKGGLRQFIKKINPLTEDV